MPDKIITFVNEKDKHYRTYYCDGVVGAITQEGLINCECFVTKKVLSTHVTYREKDTNLIPDSTDETDNLYVHEIQCCLLFSAKTAQELIAWLKRGIELQKNALNEISC
jgi:hypothetical protein